MIERKDTPAPPMQRQPPPSFERRPATKHVPLGPSPPHTPPPYKIRTRGKRALNADRQSPRETYLNGLTDVNNARGGGEELVNERVSHDLSLTDNIRYSVVDNMLLSLNPDQPEPFSTPPDSHLFPAASRFSSPKKPRRRGHTQSSSLSNDYTFPSDDSFGRTSTHVSRGRRSNSSSNFQSALGRIDSNHGEGDGPDRTRARLHQARKADAVDTVTGAALRKSRKSSRSSGASSVDFGHRVGQSRWQPAMTRRSSSFDYGQSRGPNSLSAAPVTSSPIVHSLSQPFPYINSEAAPTPTVPVGPHSRDRSPAFPPQPAHAPPQIPNHQHRYSHRSSRSFHSRKGKGREMSRESVDMMGNDLLDVRRDSDEMPSVPAFIISRNPSPMRHPQEVATSFKQTTASKVKDQAKERPGFFRRVFGSSRNMQNPTIDVRSPRPRSARDSIRAESRGSFVSPHKLTKSPRTEDFFQLQKENMPPALNKKTSSFFRRRKKSISEHNPVPVPPLHLQTHLKPNLAAALVEGRPESSPVSSLREVMNPYLGGSALSQSRENVNYGGAASTSSLPRSQNPTALQPVFPLSEVERSSKALESLKMENKNPPTETSFADTIHFLPYAENKSAKREDHLGSATRSVLPRQQRSSASKDVQSIENTTKPTGNTTDERAKISHLTPKPRRKPKPLLAQNGIFSPSFLVADNVVDHYEQENGLSAHQAPSSPGKNGLAQLRLDQERPEDEFRKLGVVDRSPNATSASPASDYQSASSTLPVPTTKEAQGDLGFPDASETNGPTADGDEIQLTEDDCIQAKRIYDGDQTLVARGKAAAWLGEIGSDRLRVRRAYMELFNWQDLNVLASLRDLCGRLLLKGETQQVDRILDAFSLRWCVCNPNHGFKATDVVHTICYSILLLNTDLHMADIEQKMTRGQFIKNTLPTIRRVAKDAAPGCFENSRASILPSVNPWVRQSSEQTHSPTYFGEQREGDRFAEGAKASYAQSARPPDQSEYSGQPPTPLDYETPVDDCGPLVKSQFHGKMSTWELQVEIVLKDFFNSIRQQRLPLHGNDDKEIAPEQFASSNTFPVMAGNVIRRTPSILSKAGSENLAYRGRQLEHRLGTGRWTSKTRSKPRPYAASTVGSSRNSLEDHSSTWSPSVSSTWSKYSFGKTPTSMSIDSFASTFPQGGYQQSIGFANALSQAIIREESGTGDAPEDASRGVPLLEDESLELAGAPWAKEGILKHKHHLDSLDKKATDRNWNENFAVIERGWMRLFSFSMNAKSLRQKAKSQKAPGGVVGGGNWTDSAKSLGKFSLRQSIASALPPPGYSKTRPHVWALSLPTGAVHLFQAGTPDIVREFVTTANYWSARLSKEPLTGAISNIEYGWSDSVINAAPLHTESVPPPGMGTGPRPSLQGSIRNSVDQGTSRPRLPGDKIVIHDWTHPQQSPMASVLLEVDQLKALSIYVKTVEEELQKHNELRGPMLLAFSPRHPNSVKAMANWERKSSYLLREIVKFRTYVECLRAAQTQKAEIQASRAPVAAAERIESTPVTDNSDPAANHVAAADAVSSNR